MTSPDLPAELKAAPLVKRFFAFMMDIAIVSMALFTVWLMIWIVLSFIFWGVGTIVDGILGPKASMPFLKVLFKILWVTAVVVLPVGIFGYYHARLDSSVLQGTIGKMLLGLRLSDMDGGRLTFKKAWWRAMNKILSMLILFLGFVPALFNPLHQALHDKMSGTLVITR